MNFDRYSRSELEMMLRDLAAFGTAYQALDYAGLIAEEIRQRDRENHISASFERMRQEVGAVKRSDDGE